MTLILAESAVNHLLSIEETVHAVEECFRQTSSSQAANTPRTRTIVPGATLNVMHGALSYLGRAGVKCYLSSSHGTRVVFILFNLTDAEPLAIMGADILGRYRTGAASAVATKYLCGKKSVRFAIAGSGNQALAQVVAMREVTRLESVKVWSPTRSHTTEFVSRLAASGIEASTSSSLAEAFSTADVATTITTSKIPFVKQDEVMNLMHLNVCGSNDPRKAEVMPQAIAGFATIAVDNLEQAKNEAGDLIGAEHAGLLSWENVVQLGEVVSGKVKPKSKTLFKSIGVAIEDIAVASLVYDKADRTNDHAGIDEFDLESPAANKSPT